MSESARTTAIDWPPGPLSLVITVSESTREKALAYGLAQFGLPDDLIRVEELNHADDDLLPGAEPLPGVTLRLSANEDLAIERARVHLLRLLEFMDVRADIEVVRRRGMPVLNIQNTDDGPLIIGRSGQNVEALQVLVNRMLARAKRETTFVAVDCQDYVEKHLRRVEDTARRAAERVLREGRSIALEPMSPWDRRIVHMVLRGIKGVHTLSEGEGIERRVVVTTARPDSNLDSQRPNRPSGPRRSERP